MHLGVSDPAGFMPGVKRAISEYSAVYTETELQPEVHARLHKQATMDPALWNAYFSAHTLAKLVKVLRRVYGIELSGYLSYRPMFISSVITQKLFSCSGVGVDQMIYDFALAEGKETLAIESFEEQLAVMGSIPISYDFLMLKKILRNVGAFSREARSLVEGYYEQDIYTIYKKSKRSLGAMRKVLLYDRNRVMAERIHKAHTLMPSFFSFGAGHMAGYTGVLRLLKHKGYKVKPQKIEML